MGKGSSQSVINYGFCSSTAEELLYYYNRLVYPYEPKVLVLSTFGNDRYFGYSPYEVLELVSRILNWARTDFPGIRLFLCTPCPGINENHLKARWKNTCNEYIMLIRMYSNSHSDCKILDQASNSYIFDNPSDCGQYDKVRRDIFLADGVHFTPEGYELFGRYLKECLYDVL